MIVKRYPVFGVLGLLVHFMIASVAMGAYSSHQNDEDVIRFLEVYPFTESTKLNDCSLCHPGGEITDGGKTKYYGSCDYCHISYGLQPPHGLLPLNAYGQAYKDAGRTGEALRSIESSDSDMDSFTNLDEIKALFFPGDDLDYPGLSPAPAVVLNQERILRLRDHSEFLFLNHSKSTDEYARYRGVKISDLLKLAGVSPNATQITVFAPDGFSKTFPISAPDPQNAPDIQYDVMGPYPRGHYYPGLDFVDYSYPPELLLFNRIVPDRLYMLLGYLRDGDPLQKGRLVPDPRNPGRLVLDGEGPYRLVVPQKVAGSPDRPSTLAATGDGWDYDPNKDHNAGFSVRSVSAIRVEPLPEGTTDFRWTEGGWNLVDRARVVIYGAIHPATYPIAGRVVDGEGNPLAGVQVSFGLVNLGQIGEATSDTNGRFQVNLASGQYIAIPFKEGYTFQPQSVPIDLTGGRQTLVFKASPLP